MLRLTDPCAKRKVLSLTKLKGKIYKTKSLRNYTTGRASEQLTDFSQNSGTYIVYNSHVTSNNSSFSLVITSHWSLRLTSLLSIDYVVCSPLATCPSPLLWADASATITKFNHVHRSRWYSDNHFVDIIFGRVQLSQHPPIHSTCGLGDIPVINPVLSMYLLTTSAVFTPAVLDNILHLSWYFLLTVKWLQVFL